MHSRRAVTYATLAGIAAVLATVGLHFAAGEARPSNQQVTVPVVAVDPVPVEMVVEVPAPTPFPAWAPSSAPVPPPRVVAAPESPATPQEYTVYIEGLKRELPAVDADDFLNIYNYCPADFNRDDKISADDIAAFYTRWLSGRGMTAYLADVNHDGVLDHADVCAYVTAYFSGDCDPDESKAIRATFCRVRLVVAAAY